MTPFQGSQGGINSPAVVTAGSSIVVNVGPNDTFVEVRDGHTGETTNLKVEPGKDITIPVPNLPGGTIIHIRVGHGSRSRSKFVEVIAPGP
jgi:hypothetical protein